MDQLVIQDLHVSIAGQEIIRGLSLAVPTGEVHAIMGPNGSGKSNMTDTVLWALGEERPAAIPRGSMQEVISAGGQGVDQRRGPPRHGSLFYLALG